MEDRAQTARELHEQKYNCAQAVACAYCDLVGMDRETMFKVSEGFGGGMGGFEQVCGAVSGAVMLAGLKNSSGAPADPPTKQGTYALARRILQAFEEKNGSLICKELKGMESGCVLRSCPGCIEDACRIVEDVVFGAPRPIE